MAARVEITKKYAAAYEAATKKQKTLMLNQVVALTGWNRDHARQRLKALSLRCGLDRDQGRT